MNNNAKIFQEEINKIDRNLSNSMKEIGAVMINEYKDNLSKEGIRMRTGQLEKSIKISEITDTSVSVTSNVDYASYVNDGTYKMKARPFFKENGDLDKKIENIIDNSIKNAVK